MGGAEFLGHLVRACRKEMPGLDRLQAGMGGQRFAVVAVATGRNLRPAIDKFLAEGRISHLTVWRDPGSDLAHRMGVLGLPLTVILDPDGREVGRLIGEADWDSDNARAVLGALIGG